MFHKDSGTYVRGLVNKMRVVIASKDRKLDYNPNRWREADIKKAKHMLENGDTEFFGKVMTLKQFFKLVRHPPYPKLNNRNHNSGSRGTARFIDPDKQEE